MMNSLVCQQDKGMRQNRLTFGEWVLSFTPFSWAVRPPRLIHILNSQFDAEPSIDTPWDEPSESSPEFCAYRTGELFNYDPWTRIRGQALGMFLLSRLSLKRYLVN